jgi:hypothetical protein
MPIKCLPSLQQNFTITRCSSSSFTVTLSLIRRTVCARAQFSGRSSTTDTHREMGQMEFCCQNLTLCVLSSHSALCLLVGALFKKFGLFLNKSRMFNIILLSLYWSPKFSPSLACSTIDSITLPFTISTRVGEKDLFQHWTYFWKTSIVLRRQKYRNKQTNTRTFPVPGHMALWLRNVPTTMHASTKWHKRDTA